MAFDTVKMQLGEDVVLGGTTNEVNGQDFNPNFTTGSGTAQSDFYIANTSTSFDLTGFQVGHEVAAAMFMVENNGASSENNTIGIRFEKYVGGSWEYMFAYAETPTLSPGERYYIYAYMGIDWDEIWTDSDTFRVRFIQGATVEQTTNFSTSNRNIQSSEREAGYIWIEGSNIHYIDGTRGSEGYEHTIDYDSGYSSFVGTDSAGYIWLDSSGNNRRIYYIDENGYKRRTYEADNWFGGASSVGTNSKGYMWVSGSSSASNGYGYLCYVANNGYKYRIMNGPV